MRPSPNLGPESHASGASELDAIPHVDAPLTRAAAHMQELATSKVRDFTRSATPVDRVRPPVSTLEGAAVVSPPDGRASLEELRTLGKISLPVQPETALKEQATTDSLPREPNTAHEHVGGSNPLPPENKATDDTVSSAGGGPNKPPVDPPVIHGGTGPEEPEESNDPVSAPPPADTPIPPGELIAPESTPAERYQVRLGTLVLNASEAIEQSPRFEGRTHTAGTLIDGVYTLRTGETMIGGDTGLDRIEKVQASAAKAIETAQRLDAWPAEMGPVDYHIDASLTQLPHHRGKVDVQRVSELADGQPGAEVLTLTTVELPPHSTTPEMLHCEISSRGSTIIGAHFTSIPETDIPAYRACLRTLGNRSDVIEVLHGNFTDTQDAAVRLQPIAQARRAHLDMQYAVDAAVVEATRIGTAAKLDRESADADTIERRIERLRHALRLPGSRS